jgi:hypothetical protein
MRLGNIRVAYSSAGVGDEFYLASPNRQFQGAPEDIKSNFPFSSGFTVPLRWGKVILVWKAYFTPSDMPGTKLPIFTLKTNSQQHYQYLWHRTEGFKLLNTDTRNGRLVSLQDRFNELLPSLKTQFFEGKAVETEVKAGLVVAVGNALAGVPPRRSVRAELPHTVPTSGAWRRSGRSDKDAGSGPWESID